MSDGEMEARSFVQISDADFEEGDVVVCDSCETRIL